ncbi:MAG: sigma-70 family RNA polymerase sigma factor [Phycisphaerales bacterium]|nr:sigma-70 family RNA polymerase sigma factor [Phycisphaerales bacterium]NNM25473.1 sigma-70 family RNA polymerase sigma factor [Phycisphaerales bacterium]
MDLVGGSTRHDVTKVLADAAAGDDGAAERLLPLVYDELRKLAGSMMANQPAGHTLQATALVHEAYLRVGGDIDPEWDGRRHFFFAASRAMRDLLVEQARRKGRLKRGGDRRRAGDVEALPGAIEEPVEDMLALDEALRSLECEDPEVAQVVMLRFFSGLTVEETAAVLGISGTTIKRRWRYAQAWLQNAMGAPPGDGA